MQKHKTSAFDIFLSVNTGRLSKMEELVIRGVRILRHVLKLANYVRFRNAGTAVLCAIKWRRRTKNKSKMRMEQNVKTIYAAGTLNTKPKY